MKKVLFAAALLFLGIVDANAISMTVFNNTACDVDVSVVALGPKNGDPCQDLGNYGTITFNSGMFLIYIDPSAVDYEIRVTVDPNGVSPHTFSVIGVTGQCIEYFAQYDDVCGGVNLTVTPTANPAHFDLDIF